jgi:hypothetical protein
VALVRTDVSRITPPSSGFLRAIGLHVTTSEFMPANPEVPASILGSTRFSEKQWVWNGVHSALLRINQPLIERKSSGSGL